METLTKHLDAAEQDAGVDLQAAKAKASKYKNLFIKTNRKSIMVVTSLKDLSKSNLGHFRGHERAGTELQRLRSDLADREDRLNRLRSQAFY